MRTRARCFCVSAWLALAAHASAQQWFAIGSPGADKAAARVEVDLDSIHARGQAGEGVIRITFNAPQSHRTGFRYRSVVASAQFDCPRQVITLTSAAYYDQPAGNGDRVGADSSGKQSGMPAELLDSIPMTTRRALLRATCATKQTSAT